MLGLDTYILKQIEKWVSKSKTDEEILSKARIVMGSFLVIHLTLAILAGWRLYKIIKAKEKTTGDLIWPIVLFITTLAIPIGTETGEELTGIPSSGLVAFATLGLSIAVFIMWFVKKNPEDKEEKKEEANL